MLRTKLANLKPDVGVYVDNQEAVLGNLLSDVSLYETGNLIAPYDLPEGEGAEDPMFTRLQLEKALKVRQYQILVYVNLTKNQGQRVLGDLQEIAALLP